MPRYKDPKRYTMILNFINDYWQQNGVSPTTREIAAGTGIPNGTAPGGRCQVHVNIP